ncbi:DUF1801 domain-containing protein [Planctomicrobium sp. SH527]|uniref:DUF1801 domain-containing protein n=1 Tax=Planctomicrobium sp. SH527 TaxID=3448123 RepID=UPI003F5BA5BD
MAEKSESNSKPKSSTSSARPARKNVTAESLAASNVTGEGKSASQMEASQLIDERIKSLDDWRGEMLSKVRRLIHEADPQITEEWKWKGTPVWAHSGIVCTGEVYKQVVKLTFARGATLDDPKQLFNSSLAGNARRAIDLFEGDELNANAFKSLIRAAIAQNQRVASEKSASGSMRKSKAASVASGAEGSGKVVLLAGGNPQIAKGDGDAPVQAYIAAMPGWKSDLGRRLDALIVQTVPEVQKAVKWNSPFYGIEGQGWFLSFHVFTRYVKVTFFSGMSLQPIPPGGTERSGDARWIDIYENDPFNEAQFKDWIRQAAAIPGWIS